MRAIISWLVVLVILLAGYSYKTDEKLSASCVGPAPSAAVVGSRVLRRMGELVNADPHPPAAIKADVDKVLHILRLLWWSLKFSANDEPMPPEILRLEKADDKRRAESPLCSAALADCTAPDNPSPGTPPSDDWDPRLASLQANGGFTAEQKTIAATAVQVAAQHQLPASAAVVAVTAGLVESEVRNLGYGDRDSLGWLQQRPSTGWGTPAQVRNPRLAVEAFYGVAKHTQNPGLVDVPNWQTRPFGEVAQVVQVSAFPARYQPRVPEARRLVAAAGSAPRAPAPVECSPVATSPGDRATPTDPGGRSYKLGPVTPETQRGADILGNRFGVKTIGGVRADPIPDHPSGRAADLMIISEAQGQRIADYAKANAGDLSVEYIIWNARIWSVQRNPEGWRPYTGTSNPHTDHVHITFQTGASA